MHGRASGAPAPSTIAWKEGGGDRLDQGVANAHDCQKSYRNLSGILKSSRNLGILNGILKSSRNLGILNGILKSSNGIHRNLGISLESLRFQNLVQNFGPLRTSRMTPLHCNTAERTYRLLYFKLGFNTLRTLYKLRR